MYIISVAIIAVSVYGMYLSQNKIKLFNLVLANVEAMATHEFPDVEITCNQNKNEGSGTCWGMHGDCYIAGLIRYDDCRFSGYMHDKCLTPCD
ncbi:NVEALA domain-containing protein [Bacteroides faecichinchillae]|uniref:NVEALA domain-containing protein n=1 Tax=Bacteroides faecichinchillae TaxID=871325 RepID=UPI0035121ADA